MMDELNQYIGKQLNDRAVTNWKDSSTQQLYKKNINSLVWRLRDNDHEKNNFVFLFIQHQSNTVDKIEIEALSISATGQVNKRCAQLTQNELTDINTILSSCLKS